MLLYILKYRICFYFILYIYILILYNNYKLNDVGVKSRSLVPWNFPAIDEPRFSVLYSEEASHPSAPVNVIVGALIIKDKNVTLITTDLTDRYTAYTMAYFEFNEDGTKVLKCPADHEPKSCTYMKRSNFKSGSWKSKNNTIYEYRGIQKLCKTPKRSGNSSIKY